MIEKTHLASSKPQIIFVLALSLILHLGFVFFLLSQTTVVKEKVAKEPKKIKVNFIKPEPKEGKVEEIEVLKPKIAPKPKAVAKPKPQPKPPVKKAAPAKVKQPKPPVNKPKLVKQSLGSSKPKIQPKSSKPKVNHTNTDSVKKQREVAAAKVKADAAAAKARADAAAAKARADAAAAKVKADAVAAKARADAAAVKVKADAAAAKARADAAAAKARADAVAAKARADALKQGGITKQANFDNKKEPTYPKKEIRLKRSGSVSLTFVIGTNGRAKNIKVTKQTSKAFGKAAKQALRDSTFHVTEINGVKIDQKAKHTFHFNLNSSN